MITKELLDFIKLEKNKGLSDENIKGILLNNGWSLNDIDKAINFPIKDKVAVSVPSNSINNNEPSKHQKQITMIKKLIYLVYLLIGIYIMYSGCRIIFSYFDNKNEWEKTVDRMDLSDHCINNTYTSDYIGISVMCPSGLMAIERYNGIQVTPKEGVSFIDKTKNMRDYNTLVNDYKITTFSIGLEYKKFDPNAYYDTTSYESNTLNQIDPYNFVNKVEAITGPKFIKVENIKKIIINGIEYYAYSRGSSDYRTDYYLYVKGDIYIKFEFNNQSESFVSNVLNSVKINKADSFYSN